MSKATTVLTCVYCGMKYPNDTPTWGADVLTEHIKICEKHPMRELEAKYAKVRKALIGLVGVDTKEELDGMEAAIRILSSPEADRITFINAITALRETV